MIGLPSISTFSNRNINRYLLSSAQGYREAPSSGHINRSLRHNLSGLRDTLIVLTLINQKPNHTELPRAMENRLLAFIECPTSLKRTRSIASSIPNRLPTPRIEPSLPASTPHTQLINTLSSLSNSNFDDPYLSEDCVNTDGRDDHKLQRGLSDFWKKGVKVPKGNHRRHIIMVSIIKSSIHSVRDKAFDDLSVPRLIEIYQKTLLRQNPDLILKPVSNDCADQIDQLKKLEIAVFEQMVDMIFNLFIGNDLENKLAADMATIIKNSEHEAFRIIDRAASKTDLVSGITSWFNNNVCSDKEFKQPRYTLARKNIEEDIRSLILPSIDLMGAAPLADLKMDLKERIGYLYDSLSADISKASHDELRRWQNRVLLPMQGTLMNLVKEPDLDKFEETINLFLDYEKEGADIIGVDLERLRDFTNNPREVEYFTYCISEPGASPIDDSATHQAKKPRFEK